MNDFEQGLVILANKYNDEPEKFAYILDEIFKEISESQRGNRLLDCSNILCTYSAFEHAKALLTLAVVYFDKKNDLHGVAACYGNLGTCCMNLHEYDNALESLQFSMKIYNLLDDKESSSICITNLGEVYRSLGDFEKAIEQHKAALDIAIDINDQTGIAVCYSNIAACYNDLGQSDQAIEYSKKALDLAIKLDNEYGISVSYSHLGIAYFDKRDYIRSLEYNEKALDISLKLYIPGLILKHYANIANCYLGMGKSNEAILYYKKAIELSRKVKDFASEATCHSNLGHAFMECKDYANAIKETKEALEIELSIGLQSRIAKAYRSLSNAYMESESYEKAIEANNQALQIFSSLKDNDGILESRVFIGMNVHDLKQFQKAAEIFSNIISEYCSLENVNIATSYARLADCYFHFGENDKAINCYEKSIEINIKICDKKNESACYTSLGDIYHEQYEYKKAVEYHEKALDIDIKLGDQQDISTSYSHLGLSYKYKGDTDKAFECYEKALGIDKALHDEKSIAGGYIDIADIYDIWGEYSSAINYYEKALEIAVSKQYTDIVAICCNNSGAIYNKKGDFLKSNDIFFRALELYELNGDSKGQACCYTNISLNNHLLGNLEEAILNLEKSYKIDLESNNKMGIISYHINISNIYIDRGEYGKAYEHIDAAGRMANETENGHAKAEYYSNIGNFYKILGKYDLALESSQKALEIFKVIGDKNAIAGCFNNVGAIYSSMGRPGKAIYYYSRGYLIYKEIGNPEGESASCLNLGIVYFNLKRYDKSKGNVLRAKEIKEKNKFAKGEPICYIYLGKLYRESGDFQEALGCYEKALSISKKYSDLDLERRIQFEEAKIYLEDLNESQKSYELCLEAIHCSEAIFGNLLEENHKIDIFNHFEDIYKFMIELCIRLKKYEEAYEYLEKAKSRAFLDLLATSEQKPSVSITPEYCSLLHKEKKYISIIRQIRTRHLKQSDHFTPGEIEEALKALDDIYKKMELIDPEYVFLRKGNTINVDELLKLLANNHPDTTMVEYYIAAGALYIFIISAHSKCFHMEAVNIPEEKLNRLIFDDYKRSVPGYAEYECIGESWLELSQYLIEPIAPYLSKGGRIYFVPYGPLHYIPLHALLLNGERVIERHTVAYLPSASLLKFCINKYGGNKTQNEVFGAEFEDEAKNISALFGIEPKTGLNATKQNVIKNCGNKDIIHFSCHGIFDDKDPLNSGIQLHDGILTAREIFDMKINASLVTLSACETGINERTMGDELIGLTRAFLYAGAVSVVVSLWSVNSLATQTFMVDFYKSLAAGINKADALRNAQISLMCKTEYSHPYFWAPFILIGN